LHSYVPALPHRQLHTGRIEPQHSVWPSSTTDPASQVVPFRAGGHGPMYDMASSPTAKHHPYNCKRNGPSSRRSCWPFHPKINRNNIPGDTIFPELTNRSCRSGMPALNRCCICFHSQEEQENQGWGMFLHLLAEQQKQLRREVSFQLAVLMWCCCTAHIDTQVQDIPIFHLHTPEWSGRCTCRVEVLLND
jgi:hypothetical protein